MQNESDSLLLSYKIRLTSLGLNLIHLFDEHCEVWDHYRIFENECGEFVWEFDSFRDLELWIVIKEKEIKGKEMMIRKKIYYSSIYQHQMKD